MRHTADLKPTYKDEESFKNAAFSISVDLNEAADWMASNFQPEQIFPVSDLEEWAEANGYKKEE